MGIFIGFVSGILLCFHLLLLLLRVLLLPNKRITPLCFVLCTIVQVSLLLDPAPVRLVHAIGTKPNRFSPWKSTSTRGTERQGRGGSDSLLWKPRSRPIISPCHSDLWIPGPCPSGEPIVRLSFWISSWPHIVSVNPLPSQINQLVSVLAPKNPNWYKEWLRLWGLVKASPRKQHFCWQMKCILGLTRRRVGKIVF